MTAVPPGADPDRPSPAPGSLDTGRASPARMYDYLLGGKNHLPADRAAAETALRALPDLRTIVKDNRAFLVRALRYLAGPGGFWQFLDIGPGIPGDGNTAETVHALNPRARVAFADFDPVVIAHTRALITDLPDGHVAAVNADVREPAAILDHPDVRAVLDFDQPVAVVMGALLHFVSPGEDPLGILGIIRQALAPGSALVLSHATSSDAPETGQAAARGWDHATSQVTLRTADEIAGLFVGFDLVDPGVVPLRRWRPDTPAPELDTVWGLGGVGLLPANPAGIEPKQRHKP